MKKKIYNWHRTISLIVAIPVMLWAASGIMHPLMTTIRPSVTTQQLTPVVIDGGKFMVSYQQALQQNSIDSIHDMRMVHIGSYWFYQVQTDIGVVPVYLSAWDGKLLKDGDALYAKHLAGLFLNGEPVQRQAAVLEAEEISPSHDCCQAASRLIQRGNQITEAMGAEKVSAFNDEYGDINKILPVYKVGFKREDGIRIYVETTQDRFVYAVDDKRAAFDKLFALFHTWEWADKLGNLKRYAMAFILLLTLLTTLAGMYVFFTTRSIRRPANERLRWRLNHRWVSITASFFTIMFAFSGAYHTLVKTVPDDRYRYFNRQMIPAGSLDLNLDSLIEKHAGSIVGFSIVKMNDSVYWRTTHKSQGPDEKTQSTDKKSWGKNALVKMPQIMMTGDDHQQLLEDGEKIYARHLADLFRNKNDGKVIATEPITRFEGEYGFVNKRLPVWKIQYDGADQPRCYVETSTGKMAARITQKDIPEGVSFSMLHKHHFMDFAGKPARDFSTIFWAAMQIAMIVVGLVYYLKRKS